MIERALARNQPHPGDPLDVLSKVGGYEIGALVGVILGAAARRQVVVLDGFISGAARPLARHLVPAGAQLLHPRPRQRRDRAPPDPGAPGAGPLR